MLTKNPKEFSGSINLNAIFETLVVTREGVKYLGLRQFANIAKQDSRKRYVLKLNANQYINEGINSTHAIKVHFEGEEYTKVKAAFGGNIPFVGNLTDWAKDSEVKKGKQVETTYFRIEMYLNQLTGVLTSGNGTTLFIPIAANHLTKGEKGYYLSFKGFPLKEIKDKTHLVKLSVNSETYNAMSDDEKKALPIIADCSENTSAQAAPIATMDDFEEVQEIETL